MSESNVYGREGPSWLPAFLSAQYFSKCDSHNVHSKNDRNLFCISCLGDALCRTCANEQHSGPGHQLLQVRKSSHHDSVRISDINKLIDTSMIQPFVINGAKIVFLNARPQPRPQKGQVHSCEVCHRGLADASRFCSVGCKLAAVAQDEFLSMQPSVRGFSSSTMVVDTSFESTSNGGERGSSIKRGQSELTSKVFYELPGRESWRNDAKFSVPKKKRTFVPNHGAGKDKEREKEVLKDSECPALLPAMLTPSPPPSLTSQPVRHRRKGIPRRAAV